MQVYPIGIPMFYAWLLFRHRHRIYPKRAIADGVSADRRMVDKKIAHTVLLWEVGPCVFFVSLNLLKLVFFFLFLGPT